MANVLEKICADKKIEIEQLKLALPLEQFKDSLQPSERSLYQNLSRPNAGFILECKKASPSKGLIREDFNLDEIIDAYAPYAAGISVLTDKKYFSGDFAYLRYVREHVTQPVLNKDFFIDPYQVYLARYHNADAILLMLSVLDDNQYRELAVIADSLQLDILTEVSNQEEAKRACELGAKIIGINNRNLRDLSTDLATTELLVPLLPKDAVIISESGIYTHQDVQRLAPLVDGFLVGSSLMSQKNVKKAVEQLLYGKVKICGITNVTDAKLVAESPASFAGLIFAKQSKRRVTIEQASEITNSVPFNYVGVFVDADVEDVVSTAAQLSLAAVQLHGNEDAHYIQQLTAKLPADCQIWRAVGVTDQLPEISDISADCILLDCKIGNQSGGTGQAFNWELLSTIKNKSNLALAGGLSPDNIQQAVATGVALLDVNSGVEDAPGQKNAQKISQLFENLRQY
ncbi:bifunctional indole-3-glycerol-phosphate synthase TrpC/phosphoribosylanthranilate isomerase TrpF [Neptunicella marina]|uniref:Multifunctional fusion protein n=1 Tax=Neptunicella marina TaxID=2125989 RepID=A0A8J6IQF0_9ALTE|nr:bifunctional indole-3-glycerol-phosphate synthase TrpC/phosphoribosylanthranilate isomerase TrpF [Neptunicella marina]